MNRIFQTATISGAFGWMLFATPLEAQSFSTKPRLGEAATIDVLQPGPVPHEKSEALYDVLDNVEGDRVLLMNPPINPMVWDEGTLRLWAIDNHNNEIHLFDDGSGVAVATWGVPAGPVSLARWNDSGVAGGERLIVVCRTSWVVCLLDAQTGKILGVLQMEDPATGVTLGEPADVLVDEATDQAYVSCSAADAVVEIDLNTWTISGVHRIASKSPVFLSFDANGDVLIAPQFSGNNTAVHRGEFPNVPEFNGSAQELGIMNLDDPAIAVSGLRDTDIFRLVRSGVSAGTVEPAASGVGTVIFGHTLNVATGDLWVLNTEANTKNPAQQGEASLNGDFAFNRLSVISLQAGQAATPHKIVDLDVFGVDGQGHPIYDETRSMAQPYNLHSTINGFTFVVGMLSDNVSLYDSAGDFVMEWDLPKGSIPRDIFYSPFLNTVFVYCWGTNEIRGYLFENPIMPPWLVLDLGADPLPTHLKEGREILFSSEFSKDKRFSCLTCHVDGQSDLALWPLSGPNDDKGPMLTQSLTGLELLHPFHWRGEQEGEGTQLMVDFNNAFTGLMGSTRKLNRAPGDEWDKFEDFVFALQQPANPFQNKRRVVMRDHQPPLFSGSNPADSLDGLDDFRLLCRGCHSFPKGTSNDFAADGVVFGEDNPHRVDFKVGPLLGLWRRHQDAEPEIPGVQLETIDFVDSLPNLPDTDDYPPLGVGFSHSGTFASLQEFVFLFSLPVDQATNITGFIDQWDNGLAPVTYRAWHVDENSPLEVFADINGYLVPQCTSAMTTGAGQSIRNGDFAVIGTFLWQGSELELRWYWDPVQMLLIPEDSSIPPQTVATLLKQARNGESSNCFIGLPVGSARRFAVDKDGDDLFNLDEVQLLGDGTNPEVVDSDGDGFWDGHEISNGSDPTDEFSLPNDTTHPTFTEDGVTLLWTSAKTAVVCFETSEQTTATIRYKSTTGDNGIAKSPYFARRHRIVLTNLDPSSGPGKPTVYDGIVTIVDHAGLENEQRKLLPLFKTMNYVLSIGRVKTGSISFSLPPVSPTSDMTVEVQAVDRQNSGPPIGMAGYQVIASITLDDGTTPVALNTMGTPQSFTIMGQPYEGLPGPFVLSTALTDVNGFAEITFSVPSALAGQKLTVHIKGLQRPSLAWTAGAPDFDHNGDWSYPDTPKELRTIAVTL